MNPYSIMSLGRHGIEVALMVAAPLLLTALVIGLCVSIFQAATQINETTLSFIPKMTGAFAMLVIAGPWMVTVITDYMHQAFTSIPFMAG